VVEDAGHCDLCDKPEYVGPAVDQLAPFFARHLVGGWDTPARARRVDD
jgi:hypothetical protein